MSTMTTEGGSPSKRIESPSAGSLNRKTTAWFMPNVPVSSSSALAYTSTRPTPRGPTPGRGKPVRSTRPSRTRTSFGKGSRKKSFSGTPPGGTSKYATGSGSSGGHVAPIQGTNARPNGSHVPPGPHHSPARHAPVSSNASPQSPVPASSHVPENPRR